MTIRTASALAATLGLLATPATAEPLPATGRYRCVLVGMGGCAPDGVGGENCTGMGVGRRRATVLRLDFDRNRARLGPLHGSILRDGDGGRGPPAIAWHLNLLGLQSITFSRMDRLQIVRLRRDASGAEFSCRRAG